MVFVVVGQLNLTVFHYTAQERRIDYEELTVF